MVWAAPALAAVTLCLRVSTDPVKATAAALIVGAVLSNAEHPHLGAPVCDLEPGTIPASDPNALEKLKLCPVLTEAQQDALNALLLSGDTAYGDPSRWDLQTLQDLGPLVLALNQTTLSLVAEAAREDFRRSIAAAYISQGRSQREKSLILLRALAAASAASQPRLRRSTDRCQTEPITTSNIEDISLLSPEELDLCLSNDVLIANLEAVLEEPITIQAFWVLKKKVDEYFQGSGIPEEQLRRLGTLSRLYTEQEISQWQVTSSDTLSALLSDSGGEWNDSQVQQLLSRYLALGGSLTGPLLQEIGGKHLCNMQEEQIQQIPVAAIRTAGRLDISSCSQSKKDQLYGKAREAFASLASTPSLYYCQIQPYLGGAPAEDLKNLSNAGVAINMDLGTFLTLNSKELQKLSVTDVKHLLGENLHELKEHEQEPLVVSWVQQQSQKELDCVLNIGLQGGRPEPTGTASPAATSTATVITPVPTTPASVTSTATVTTPVPTTPATVTSTATVTTPVPTTPASVTSMTTVPTSHPSASVTVPTTTAISSHSTPQPSTVPPRTPTPSTQSPTPPGTPAHTGGPTVPPVPTATPSARPTVTSAAPCSTHQAPTTDRATSPAVTLLSTLLATSSPSATPVPAVTSRATTSTSVGTNLAGTTHSTVTTVPSHSPAPTTTHSIVTTVPSHSSAPTTTHSTVPNHSSAPTATHSTVTTVPNSTSAPTATPVPNPSSAPTATHSTVTPIPNPTSSPTPKPSCAHTATPVPHSSSAPTATHSSVTTVPNPSSAPTATHSTVTTVPNPASSPSPKPSSVPTATPVPSPSSVPTATPAPHTPTPLPSSTIPTQTSLGTSPAVPCQPSSPPSPAPSPNPTPGSVPEPAQPTSNGHINLQPEPGSGSRLCSCLALLLAATVGNVLLGGLL